MERYFILKPDYERMVNNKDIPEIWTKDEILENVDYFEDEILVEIQIKKIQEVEVRTEHAIAVLKG